uniref:Ninja-family protein n=1 Tax=Ananas comosus var. bracteatus TaxID=296719 RepID=A0A6V7QTZ5_ANACO
MEDENGLELSLGLSFGGSSAKSKAKDPTSDPKLEEGSSNKGHVNSSDIHFTSFFQAKTEKSDPIPQPQRSFWTDLGKSPIASSSNTEHVGQSQNPIFQELWMPANKGNDTDEERSSLNKRKMSSEDINFQIKHQKRNSHVSINTGDGSTGENEDVGESEVEGSSSWLVSQSEVSTKRSDVHNYKIADKQLGSESNSEIGKVAYGIPLSFQAVNVMTVPYPVPFKVASASGTAAAAPFNSSCVMQYMPFQLVKSQLEDKEGMLAIYKWLLGTHQCSYRHSRPIHSGHWGGKNRVMEHLSRRMLKMIKGNRTGQYSCLAFRSNKQAVDAGPSSAAQAEEENKGNNTTLKQKEAANEPALESTSHISSFIKPGIAANLKFGGSGSRPDLPWVSTTGPGPNGKTISGVTYKYNENQVKIVCACHATHMSPEEFVKHASTDGPNQEDNNNNNMNAASFPAGHHPAASAQN